VTVPREWVDELLQQVDLRRIVEQTGHVVTGRGDNLGIECPICHKDGQHCKLDVRKQLWHCFVCGASGNAIHWLRETQNVGFREAVRRLAELAGMTVPIEERSASTRELLALAADHYMQFHHVYIRDRGISEAVSKGKKVGYAPGGTLRGALGKQGIPTNELMAAGLVHEVAGKTVDRFYKRVVVPIVKNGHVVDLYGRSVEESRLPHLYALGKEVAFGWDDVCPGDVIVVESVMNALTLRAVGHLSVLAVGGTARFDQGIVRGLLHRGCKRIVLAFDTGDVSGAGQAATIEAIQMIRDSAEVEVVQFPKGQDLNDVWRQPNGPKLWQGVWERRISGARYQVGYTLDRMREEDIEWYVRSGVRGQFVHLGGTDAAREETGEANSETLRH